MRLPDLKPEFPTDPDELSVLAQVARNRFFPKKQRNEAINLLWVAAKRGDLPADILDNRRFGILYQAQDGSVREAWFTRDGHR